MAARCSFGPSAGKAIVLAVALVLTVGISSPAGAATTVRASVDIAGGDPNGDSYSPSISPTGRYVAFASLASDLVPGDGNGWADVFVRDVVAGTTTRASVDTAGEDPNGVSYDPSISATGRYVAFWSYASDLVSGDGNGWADVFVRDVVAGTTTRVSVDIAGGDPNDDSVAPSISATGRYVAFFSYASDLVPGDGNGWEDVFVRDLVAGTTTRVSVDIAGGNPNDGSLGPSISATGRYVAFESLASDLVPEDGNQGFDVFVRDVLAGTTTRVSVDIAGGDPDDYSWYPSINATGRYVAFYSDASDLVPGDGNGFDDVFVRDVVAGITTRASVDTAGGDPNGVSYDPSISATGRYVAFRSDASDLVPGDGNGAYDVFVRDVVAGTTTRVSVDVAGGDPNNGSFNPSISATGRLVAFQSYASDLVPGDVNGNTDVFLARRL